MRPLREDERDEIESVKYFIEYVITAKNIEEFEISSAMKKMNDLSEKYVFTGIVSEEELSELTDLDDTKELVEKFFNILCMQLKEEI